MIKYQTPPLTQYIVSKAVKKKVPAQGTFELTPCCNLSCKMCYVRLSKEEQEKQGGLRSAAEWLRIAEEARDQGLLFLLLTGGEPFIRKDLPELVKGLQKLGIVVSLNSNGTLINEKTVEWLKRTPPSRINITLYGFSNETYQQLSGIPDGFDRVMKALTLLKEAGIAVKLNCSVTPLNVQDMPAIIRFATENEYPLQITTYMFPPLRRDENQVGHNMRFNPEEAALHLVRAQKMQYGIESIERSLRQCEEMVDNTDEDCQLELSKEGDKVLCTAGRGSFWITWKGELSACGMIPHQGNDVFETGFSEAWKKIVEETDAVRLPVTCRDCSLKEACRPCMAMTLTETGKVDQVPQYKCAMTKAMKKAYQTVLRTGKEENGNETT